MIHLINISFLIILIFWDMHVIIFHDLCMLSLITIEDVFHTLLWQLETRVWWLGVPDHAHPMPKLKLWVYNYIINAMEKLPSITSLGSSYRHRFHWQTLNIKSWIHKGFVTILRRISRHFLRKTNLWLLETIIQINT